MTDPADPSIPAPPPAAAEPAWPGPGEDAVAALEARLGFPLGNRVTAMAALTHKSYVNEHRGEALLDNERLEFLGDAVIDLAVSHRLMERFPGAREGDLSKMRAAVVDEQGLAAMARAIDLGALLRLGRGEELTGGRKKASLLADAMEAVVAAVYLDGGLPGVLRLVDRFLGEAFARAAAGTLDRDYKTQLQELAQSRFKATPRYRVVGESGPDHAKLFVVELDLKGEVLGHGSGRSKKDAEQAAARPALEALMRRCAEEVGGALGSGPLTPALSPSGGEGDGLPTPSPSPQLAPDLLLNPAPSPDPIPSPDSEPQSESAPEPAPEPQPEPPPRKPRPAPKKPKSPAKSARPKPAARKPKPTPPKRPRR